MSNTSAAPLTFALIGCGRVSVKHLKAYFKNSENLRFVAIADSNPDAPAKLFKDAGLSKSQIRQLNDSVRIYTDYREMLETEKPDMTAITTPSGLHYRMAKDAMEAGSHLLLEKPMTMSSEEARSLYDISQRTGRKIAMGHIYRYFPIVGLLQEDIRDGVFGDISHGSVLVRWGHDQAYYDQAPWRGTWKSDGGALMNQTIHALDLMCWLMGSPAVSAVSSIARRFHDIEAEDIGMGILQLENGALCQIEGTTNTPTYRHEAAFQITGTKGSATLGLRKGIPFFDIRSANGRSLKSKYFRRQLKLSGWRALLDFFNPHIGIYKDLIQAIRTNQNPIADAAAGYTSVDMILALYLSAKDGRRVELPLTEEFCSENMAGFFEQEMT